MTREGSRDVPLETEDENLANRGLGTPDKGAAVRWRRLPGELRPEGERAVPGTRESGEKGLLGRKHPI